MPMPPGVRVLIVEDESLIALSIADVLADEGLRIIGPVSSQDEALALLEASRPDVAVLDLSLRDGFCAGLAKELQARRVPFVVFSGHRRHGIPAEHLRDAPWIEKPGTIADILAGIALALENAAAGPQSPRPAAA